MSIPFHISLFDVTEVYGVPIPVGFTGNEVIEFYKDKDGWHIGGDCGGLIDDDWAPATNRQADELRLYEL